MKILITDDHALLRDSLSLLLTGRFGSDLQLLHAENGHIALQQVETHADLDLILLDIDLPDIHGFQVLKQIAQQAPSLPVIAVSGSITPPFHTPVHQPRRLRFHPQNIQWKRHAFGYRAGAGRWQLCAARSI